MFQKICGYCPPHGLVQADAASGTVAAMDPGFNHGAVEKCCQYDGNVIAQAWGVTYIIVLFGLFYLAAALKVRE